MNDLQSEADQVVPHKRCRKPRRALHHVNQMSSVATQVAYESGKVAKSLLMQDDMQALVARQNARTSEALHRF